jgi:uncharacterized protein (DUF2147 family)
MKHLLTLALTLFAVAAFAQNPVLGKWKTVDDETGRIKSVVEVTERDGKIYGQVIELFRLPEEDQNPICDQCEDDRKDQPALGMEIVRDMVPLSPLAWGDGTICDPKNGKIYDCEMWFEEDNMDELKVRGYIWILFRTQTWLRQ